MCSLRYLFISINESTSKNSPTSSPSVMAARTITATAIVTGYENKIYTKPVTQTYIIPETATRTYSL